MEKSNLILSLCLGALLFAGCNKKELDITMNEVVSGDLKITVQNDAGTGISGLAVKLYDINTNGTLEIQTSDANGNVTFNNILYGGYEVTIEKIALNGMEYNVYQPVQVINGTTKEYTITPSEYSGTATITVRDGLSGDPIEGINVGIFNTDDFVGPDFQDISDILLKTGVTNVAEKITFENLPYNMYGVIVYNDDIDYEFSSNLFYVNEIGEEIKPTFYF
jgi:hypothetical protein